AVFYTLAFLAHLERRGVRVVNGYRAFATETSKALQLALLERLGLPYPKARVIHHPTQAPRAAEELRFPVLVKPNIGGSGVGVALERTACPVDAPQTGMTVEGETPPAEVVADVERLMAAAGIEIGGVEYLVDSRDGRRYYYDVNALSNFVADAPRVVGFDPVERLVDYLEQEAA